jgi:hypothetical protein
VVRQLSNTGMGPRNFCPSVNQDLDPYVTLTGGQK